MRARHLKFGWRGDVLAGALRARGDVERVEQRANPQCQTIF